MNGNMFNFIVFFKQITLNFMMVPYVYYKLMQICSEPNIFIIHIPDVHTCTGYYNKHVSFVVSTKDGAVFSKIVMWLSIKN